MLAFYERHAILLIVKKTGGHKMTLEQVTMLIKKEIGSMGYEVEERKSTTSKSLYFKIRTAKASLLFRVSDHRPNTNVITLRTDKKLTDQQVRAFARNRIKDLQKRSLYTILNSI